MLSLQFFANKVLDSSSPKPLDVYSKLRLEQVKQIVSVAQEISTFQSRANWSYY